MHHLLPILQGGPSCSATASAAAAAAAAAAASAASCCCCHSGHWRWHWRWRWDASPNVHCQACLHVLPLKGPQHCAHAAQVEGPGVTGGCDSGGVVEQGLHAPKGAVKVRGGGGSASSCSAVGLCHAGGCSRDVEAAAQGEGGVWGGGGGGCRGRHWLQGSPWRCLGCCSCCSCSSSCCNSWRWPGRGWRCLAPPPGQARLHHLTGVLRCALIGCHIVSVKAACDIHAAALREGQDEGQEEQDLAAQHSVRGAGQAAQQAAGHAQQRQAGALAGALHQGEERQAPVLHQAPDGLQPPHWRSLAHVLQHSKQGSWLQQAGRCAPLCCSRGSCSSQAQVQHAVHKGVHWQAGLRAQVLQHQAAQRQLQHSAALAWAQLAAAQAGLQGGQHRGAQVRAQQRQAARQGARGVTHWLSLHSLHSHCHSSPHPSRQWHFHRPAAPDT